MGVSLDLRKAHFSRHHGDIVVVATWVNDQRCLVLIPAYRKDAGWFIIEDSAAWKWNLNEEDPITRRQVLDHINTQTQIACAMLGIEPTRINRGRIANMVCDTLGELIRMPAAPLPEYLRGAAGQMILKADGKPIAGDDIKVEVEGATYG